jgi:branched-chain amino acid transport system ATP-binding protein
MAGGLAGSILGGIYFGKAHKEEVEQRRVIEEIIDFLEIEPIRKQIVGTVPYGLRKRVELGRALALQPKLLLMDEPMAGMNLEEKEDMARFILDIYEERVNTIVLIEHDMGVVMDISHRVAVLDFGRKIAEGTPSEIKTNPAVIKAYLGTGKI